MSERLVHRMRRSLNGPVPPPAWPKDVRLVPFVPDDHAQRIHSLLVTAYAHGGGSVATFDIWWPRLRDDAQFDPALCLVAVNENNDVAAVAQCWTSAFIKDLAVAPAYRRQGLGAALLHEAFRVFRERGAAFIELKVEADNPSGALRLYRGHGFKEVESYFLP
ncbi:GNAT family N-acetyltransferase [Microvirga sp. ACRRW]|uniref:GNAT family N-acetyltransferase n=1 Tax=Microvirga sp. ACRRW TaxID=2918205 RepID=UPI001EF7012C|nr:GNAT family N-acetyltransferase [Microvirga sp. ACRRW]MCG7394867.1 GNAT family N-acetyltransferase [Microvirga sp. ACRRW]